MGTINVLNNIITLTNVKPNSVITLTTKSNGKKGTYPISPPKIAFPLPYSDNFSEYEAEVQPKYFSDQAGSFAIAKAFNKENDYAFEQVVPYSPSLNNTGWHNNNAPQPLTIIGDHNMTNYNVTVDCYIISNNQKYEGTEEVWNTSNVMIGLRLGGKLQVSGCRNSPREYPCVQGMGGNWFSYGYFLQINDNGYWKLMPGATNGILIDGNLNLDLRHKWFTVNIILE